MYPTAIVWPRYRSHIESNPGLRSQIRTEENRNVLSDLLSTEFQDSQEARPLARESDNRVKFMDTRMVPLLLKPVVAAYGIDRVRRGGVFMSAKTSIVKSGILAEHALSLAAETGDATFAAMCYDVALVAQMIVVYHANVSKGQGVPPIPFAQFVAAAAVKLDLPGVDGMLQVSPIEGKDYFFRGCSGLYERQ